MLATKLGVSGLHGSLVWYVASFELHKTNTEFAESDLLIAQLTKSVVIDLDEGRNGITTAC